MADNNNAPIPDSTRGITADNIQLPQPLQTQPITTSHKNGFTLDNIQPPEPTAPSPTQESSDE